MDRRLFAMGVVAVLCAQSLPQALPDRVRQRLRDFAGALTNMDPARQAASQPGSPGSPCTRRQAMAMGEDKTALFGAIASDAAGDSMTARCLSRVHRSPRARINAHRRMETSGTVAFLPMQQGNASGCVRSAKIPASRREPAGRRGDDRGFLRHRFTGPPSPGDDLRG